MKGEAHICIVTCGMPLSPVETDAATHVAASVNFFLRACAPAGAGNAE